MRENNSHVVKLKSQKKAIDLWFMGSCLVLVFIGLIAIYDASVVAAFRDFNDKAYFFKNQLTWSLLGLLSMAFFTFFDYRRIIKISHILLGISFVFLLLVFIPALGPEILGARRWLNIGTISFQPSEFAKIATVAYATMIMAKFQDFRMKLFDTMLVYFLPIGIITALVAVEPDLGTALIFLATTSIIYFAGNAPFWHFLLAVPVIILGAIVEIIREPYRMDRIKAFLDPSFDPQGASYQINQIIIALASGGLFGVGLGASRSKFEFIPEVHNDAIFAVIVEETGFIGALVLIGIFLFLINRGLKIAREAKDYEGKILATGLVGLIASQTLLNLSAIVALVPLTGIPLPFISYGGSFMFVTLTSIGILLNIKRNS